MKLKVLDVVLGYIKLPRARGGGGGEGGRGGLNKFVHEKAPPRGPTPYPFIYHFSR